MRNATKLGLVILAASLLFFNPAVLCALMTQPDPPAHDCCPKSSSPQQDCAKPHCDGVNGTLTASADLLPIIDEAFLPVEFAAITAQALVLTPNVSAEAPPPPLARYVTFAQFRV